jgi:hypothetical protein
MTKRDEFSQKTKTQLAKRAGWLCSDPSCRRPTVGSNSDGNGEINLGVAAHICAAAPEGPRYDPSMTSEQRKSTNNGIWLCQLHGKAVDAKDSAFTVELLHEWKARAQDASMRNVLYNDVPHGPTQRLAGDELGARVRAAATHDMDVFRRSEKWPTTSIPLTLEIKDVNDPVSTSALAKILTALDDLVLVAPPGMGKTTTLFQIAEAVLTNGNASPIIIPLGDWSTDASSLIESVLKRPAFEGISERDLRVVASKAGVILLLDGWNELDGSSRKRAAAQVKRLQLEIPEISLLISTRKQALDVPIDGTRINLLPLNEKQQLAISNALRGDAGERIVDQAWRTPGVRELITIPLYLTALLTLPEGEPFPTTKEELLRQFVAAHEKDNQRIDELTQATQGFHRRFLEDLATTTTRAANTTITETAARKSVSDTVDALISERQITNKPDPGTILEALVNFHVLMRSGEPAGYSFNHQQFQEWYASHFVERLILTSIGDRESQKALKAEVLNQPAWEEAILFSCERLSRGNMQQQDACGATILAAFSVDPLLASEMISRSTHTVWGRIEKNIMDLIRKWHTSGKADRALSFMISSGRPEFFDKVWPLITHKDDQVHLTALRASRRFRASLLGHDAAKRIAALPPEIRENVLLEIAAHGGVDGLDLAAAIAKTDTNSAIKAKVVETFWFRRADRHVIDVLRDADDETLDLLAHTEHITDVKDEAVKAKLVAAHERQIRKGIDPYRQIYSLARGSQDVDQSKKLETLIAEIEIDNKNEGAVNAIYEAQNRYPQAVANGVLRRIQGGLALPYRAHDLLVGSNFNIEDSEIYKIALEADSFDNRANAAASVLGPLSIIQLIKATLEVKNLIRGEDGKYDQIAGNRYRAMRGRFAFTQSANLLAAISSLSKEADTQEIPEFADLICLHAQEKHDRKQPLGDAILSAISELVTAWGNTLLDSPDVTRSQLASIVMLASYSPSPDLLPLLKRMLDKELSLWSGFKEQAKVEQYRDCIATREARMSWVLQYQRAFQANSGADVMTMMCEYLSREDFGYCASLVLAEKWRNEHEPSDRNIWQNRNGFSRVAEKRTERTLRPTKSSTEADAILKTVETLMDANASDAMKKHAVALATVAMSLPHGQRPEIIKTILANAPVNSLEKFLRNLILSGETVDVKLVKQGIFDLINEDKKKAWLSTDNYELRSWIRLLPFTNKPGDSIKIVQSLPEQYLSLNTFEELIDALKFAPGDEAENVLFLLAETNLTLYKNHNWREAVLGRGTISAAKRFVDLISSGVFDTGRSTDHWHNSKSLANLIEEFAELRAHIYDLLENGPGSPGFDLLVQSVIENPDEAGLLLLVQLEIKYKRTFASWRTVQNVITEHVPDEHWKGAYNVIVVPTIELRRKLLALTTDGGANDAAARCLTQIDKLRDENGTPESEPRHPDLESGKPWPIMTFDPDASEFG